MVNFLLLYACAHVREGVAEDEGPAGMGSSKTPAPIGGWNEGRALPVWITNDCNGKALNIKVIDNAVDGIMPTMTS